MNSCSENLRLSWPVQDDRESVQVVVYCDTNLATPRSRGGFIVGIEGDSGVFLPLSFSSKRQAIASDSTTAAECMAIHAAFKGAVLVALMMRVTTPIVIRTDSLCAIKTIDKGYTTQILWITLALGIKVSFMSDMCSRGIVSFQNIAGQTNPADQLTKLLTSVRSQEKRRLVGIDSFDVKGSSNDHDDNEDCSLAEEC